jgi:hypothetical protein
MTKVIGVLIIVLAIFGVWELWSYWDQINQDKDLAQKKAVATRVIGDQLAGMPNGMEPTYQAAVKGGPAAVKNWLRRYVQSVQDPRRAWIELDYMVAIARDEPAEARKIFAEVKNRTPETSPVYGRIKELEHTYK